MIESLFSMQDKICVVTGGSRGLGSFMAQGFLEAGAKRVYITARPVDPAASAAQTDLRIWAEHRASGDRANRDTVFHGRVK